MSAGMGNNAIGAVMSYNSHASIIPTIKTLSSGVKLAKFYASLSDVQTYCDIFCCGYFAFASNRSFTSQNPQVNHIESNNTPIDKISPSNRTALIDHKINVWKLLKRVHENEDAHVNMQIYTLQ